MLKKILETKAKIKFEIETNNKQQKISTATNNKTKTFIANTFTKNPTNTHKYPMLKLSKTYLVIPN